MALKNLFIAFTTLCIACLIPFLTLAEFNKSGDVDYQLLAGYGLGLVVVAFSVLITLKVVLRLRTLVRLAHAFAAFLLAFFSFDVLSVATNAMFTDPALSTRLSVWAGVTAAVVVVTWYLSAYREVRLVLFASFAAMFAVPIFKLAAFEIASLNERSVAVAAISHTAFKSRPNIYFFILDGYARADKIKSLLGFDNSQFLAELRGREFYVVEKATANYPTTWLSVSSTLSMKYIQTSDMPPYRSVAPFFQIMRGENAVVNRLRSQGYKYVYVANGLPNFQCSGIEDYCIQGRNNRSPLAQTEIVLLRSTPVYDLVLKYKPELVIQPFLGSVAQISDVDREIVDVRALAPYYVYAHLIVPHPPFILNSQCERTGNNNINLRGWHEVPISGYVGYLQCANSQMLSLIDRILKKDNDAIIIVQGDHGTSFFLDWKKPLKEWSRQGYTERLAPLSVMRLPKRCQHALYPTMSLVNTFPSVFACLENRKPDYLPDASYISPDSDNPEFGSVLRVDPYIAD